MAARDMDAHREVGVGRDGAGMAGPEPLMVHLVPMRRRHLRSVLRIEAQVYARPWSLGLFVSELALRSARAYHVAKVGGTVVGYAGLMLTGEEAHVTTIAVDPAWHRRQVATRLLLQMAHLARDREASLLTLEVRVSNDGAQALYRRFGFKPVGVRRNYYTETNEDALIMSTDDIAAPAYAERLAAIAAELGGSTVADGGRW
ncbi:MAG: ribosomal protein S18-alanine N-acetyltransferase [Acidimicrobiales bacterium]